jgi:hypothetical protein
MIQAGVDILKYYKLINSVWNKEELPDQGKSQLLYQFAQRVTKLTVIVIAEYHYYQLHTNVIEYLNYWGLSVWVST